MQAPEEILSFWLEELDQSDWYKADDALDRKITERFRKTWELARDGGLMQWLAQPKTGLAYILLTDQFPRNMFRGTAEAFATDQLALNASKKMIDRGWDLRIHEPERQFIYLPMMHSECLSDQERCVRLMCTRMPETGDSNLLHAKAHRQVIREFGRFPYRNDALSRPTREVEAQYLQAGGYGHTVRALGG